MRLITSETFFSIGLLKDSISCHFNILDLLFLPLLNGQYMFSLGMYIVETPLLVPESSVFSVSDTTVT